MIRTDTNLAIVWRENFMKTVGNIFTFGRYEQDNDTSNGSEAIEWQVLDVQGNNVFIISKYILDIKPYN